MYVVFFHEHKLHNFGLIDARPSILNNSHYGIYVALFKMCTMETERLV